ncbi:MAG: ribonuclease HII [Nitrososphaerota archaeon]
MPSFKPRPHILCVLLGGVDEAGRGAVLGPLVVAGVCLRPDALTLLRGLGVRDSKRLTASARQRLFPLLLRACVRVEVEELPPSLVDSYVAGPQGPRGLNRLEALAMARVIARLGATRVYVDSPDLRPLRFRRQLREALKSPPRLTVAHHADGRYLPVAAASIVAKVLRDRRLAELRAHGEVGSGYPADPATRRFLASWLARHGNPPPFARSSWGTLKKLRAPRQD